MTRAERAMEYVRRFTVTSGLPFDVRLESFIEGPSDSLLEHQCAIRVRCHLKIGTSNHCSDYVLSIIEIITYGSSLPRRLDAFVRATVHAAADRELNCAVCWDGKALR